MLVQNLLDSLTFFYSAADVNPWRWTIVQSSDKMFVLPFAAAEPFLFASLRA